MPGTIVEELKVFVARHRRCGPIIGDATDLTNEGYAVWLKCACGSGFGRWVTPEEAWQELIVLGGDGAL
jgi:hypothetical protein